MRINIAEPCLASLAGHFLDRALEMSRTLAGDGHSVAVYGHCTAGPEVATRFPAAIPFAPMFRADLYAPVPMFPAGRQVSAYVRAARLTAADLAAAEPADLWIWPTLYAPFLRASASIRPITAISGVIHNPLTTFGNPRIAALIWREAAFRIRRSGHEIRGLGVTNEPLAAELRPILGHLGLRILPQPHLSTRRIGRKSRLATVGFFGFQRPEKGQGGLLDALVDALAADGFAVILQDSGSGRTGAIASHGPVRRYGFVDDLFGLMSEADLVVLPYVARDYAKRYSGIGGMAISLGVPVLAPAATGAAEMLASYATGSTFEGETPAAILAEVRRMRDDYARYADAAVEASAHWAERNSTARHLAPLLGKAA